MGSPWKARARACTAMAVLATAGAVTMPVAGGASVPAEVIPPATTVSITTSIDVPGFCPDGPTVRAVVDVPLGVGPELTDGPSEVVSDPCGFEASVSVDVDPATGRVLIAPAVVAGAQQASVTIVLRGTDGATLVTDTLWTDRVEGCGMLAPSLESGEGTTRISWSIEDGCGRTASLMDPLGSTVLDLTAGTATTTTALPVVGATGAAATAPMFTG